MEVSVILKQINLETIQYLFRRDLRLDDNCGLYHALKSGNKVLPIFIFDTEIIHKLPKEDARIEMIHAALGKLSDAMKRNRCNVGTYHGKPKAVFESLLQRYPIKKVITNHDYEPYAQERDDEIGGIAFETYKDQVIFENEVVKDDGLPYKVYTPYARKWLARFEEKGLPHYPSEDNLNALAEIEQPECSLVDMGFQPSKVAQPIFKINEQIIREYEATRNFPALDATSRIGAHLRFGTLSVRKMVATVAKEENPTFLKELIWREFFMQILWHFPHTENKRNPNTTASSGETTLRSSSVGAMGKRVILLWMLV